MPLRRWIYGRPSMIVTTTTMLAILACQVYMVAASQAAGTETLIGIVGKDFILLGADSSVSQGYALAASNRDKIAHLVEPFLDNDDERTTTTTSQQQQQAIVAAVAGDVATSDRLIRMLQAYATIHEYEAGLGCDVRFVDAATPKVSTTVVVEPGMTVEAMAYLARSTLSASRPGSNVCLLIAGMMLSMPDDPKFLSGRVQQQVQQAWKNGGTKDDSKELTEKDLESSELVLRPHLYWLDEFGSLQKIQYGAHGLGSNLCLSVLDQGYSPDMTLEEATSLLQDCFQQLRTRFLINSPQPPCIKCVNANGIRLIR